MLEFFKSRFEKHDHYEFLSLKFSVFISFPGRGGYGFLASLRMTFLHIAARKYRPLRCHYYGVSKGGLLYFDNFLLTNDKNSGKMWQNGRQIAGAATRGASRAPPPTTLNRRAHTVRPYDTRTAATRSQGQRRKSACSNE